MAVSAGGLSCAYAAAIFSQQGHISHVNLHQRNEDTSNLQIHHPNGRVKVNGKADSSLDNNDAGMNDDEEKTSSSVDDMDIKGT